MKNMTLPKVAVAVNGRIFINGTEIEPDSAFFTFEAEGVVIDSRLCKKDYIFVAIKGEKTDGHDYIEKVLDEGAMAVICERLPEGYEKRSAGAYILVEDCLKSLRTLAAYYRSQLSCKITGIVGSVGKTSTKELVASVLSQDFNTLKTAGNYNNEIGVPLTIFNIRDSHKMAVVEMGISDFGEMDRLGEIVKPDIVVMTNIGPCHLENLKDLDGVLRAKSEVLRHIKRGGLLVINSDDSKLVMLKKLKSNNADYINIIDDADRCALEHIEITCYGSGDHYGCEPDVRFENLKSKGVEGSIFDMLVCQKDFGISTRVNMQGTHQVMNSLAACIVGLACGMQMDRIVKGIGAAIPMKGRCCPDRKSVV